MAEVIGTSVDILVYQSIGNWPTGYRHVDDFFLCFTSSADAEAALTAIRAALREFELDINPAKTRIFRTEELREESWVAELNTIELDDHSASRQRRYLHKYFSYALDAAKDDEDAIKYALRKSSATVIDTDNWQIYEAYLLRAGQAAPNCIPTVAQLLLTYKSLDYDLNLSAVNNFCSGIILDSAPLEHHSEVAWALWLAYELGLKLPAKVTRALSAMKNSVCALITLHMREEGLLRGKLDVSAWLELVSIDAASDGFWLFAYEAIQKKWLKPTSDTVNIDGHYGAMLAADVYFYDTKARVKPLIRVADTSDGNWGIDRYEFDDWADDYAD